MLAMVLGALAPTLAHAWVAASDEGQWIEVCSASGMVWLKADGSDASSGGLDNPDMPMADMAQHCPWCSLHGAAAGLPPEMARAVVTPEKGAAMPVWRGPTAWVPVLSGALARAPPQAA